MLSKVYGFNRIDPFDESECPATEGAACPPIGGGGGGGIQGIPPNTNGDILSGGSIKPGSICPPGQTNPYSGPVGEKVMVVDSKGNTLVVSQGQSIGSSPNGQYQEIKGPNGERTGYRMDKGGHPNQSDPAAQDPHAHVPGMTNNGNPHLPIR
jgi:hypothetical protein